MTTIIKLEISQRKLIASTLTRRLLWVMWCEQWMRDKSIVCLMREVYILYDKREG